jgi:hypothetical protein
MHPKPLQLKTPPERSGAVQILIRGLRPSLEVISGWSTSMTFGCWRISSRVRLMCNQLHKETRMSDVTTIQEDIDITLVHSMIFRLTTTIRMFSWSIPSRLRA